MSHTWGRPAAEPGAGWAVVDVETSGFRPGQARIVSVAALAVGDDGNVERSVSSLLNPGVDPGPTHVHGLTAEMLAGQPCFADVAPDLVEVLRGRTLVAHNVGFDYSFLAAEAELASVELPIDSAMCTVELARRLDLDCDNMRLETLASHWGISQMKPHDALDDALVLAQILKPALVRARERKVWLPLRPVRRRQWPSGLVTHEELRPLKMIASRMPCPYLNPGRFVPADLSSRACASPSRRRCRAPTRNSSSAFCMPGWPTPTPSTRKRRSSSATSPRPSRARATRPDELGVPLVSDADFMACLDGVIGGTDIEEFTDHTLDGGQFALF